ncbi:hypothetical protein [Pukyongiella litopenaei]|uniref:hypothetical protein n=1 Tax=Pukyongiella litopenaei TaxID=2605946 RepID=UPI001B802B94
MTGAILTPAEIEDRFEEATLTLKQMPSPPGSGPFGHGSNWPAYVQEAKQAYPTPRKPAILAGRDTGAVVKPAGKHETAPKHLRRLDPRGNGIPGVFREFELNPSLGFALDRGDPFASEIAQVVCQLEPCADRPDLFRQQRSFLSDDPAIVPGSALRGDGGWLDSWHSLPSNPPARPRHQHRADI